MERHNRRYSKHRRRGMVTMWFTVTLGVLLLFVGFASDTGWVYLVDHQLQNAADAGALAGAQQLGNGTNVAVSAATAAAQANKAGGAYVQLAANPSNAATGDVVIGVYDQATGAFTATLTNPNAVQVTCRRTSSSPGGALPLHFAALAGFSSSNVTTHSIAMTGGAINGGLVALDPSATGAVQVNASGSSSAINVSGGGVYVNSSSSSAVQWSGNATIGADSLYINGNDTAVAQSGIFPSGHLGLDSPQVADPLASISPPSKGQFQLGIGPNLQPGYYPFGISGNVTLAPGTYYIDGGVNLTGNQSIKCSGGCTLYLHSGSINCTGNSSISLTAPTSGAYEGVCVYQDRSNTSQCSFSGNCSCNCTGTVYCPAANVSCQSAQTTKCSQLVCGTVSVGGNGWGSGWHGGGSGSVQVNYTGSYPVDGHEVYLVK